LSTDYLPRRNGYYTILQAEVKASIKTIKHCIFAMFTGLMPLIRKCFHLTIFPKKQISVFQWREEIKKLY